MFILFFSWTCGQKFFVMTNQTSYCVVIIFAIWMINISQSYRWSGFHSNENSFRSKNFLSRNDESNHKVIVSIYVLCDFINLFASHLRISFLITKYIFGVKNQIGRILPKILIIGTSCRSQFTILTIHLILYAKWELSCWYMKSNATMKVVTMQLSTIRMLQQLAVMYSSSEIWASSK